MSEKISVIIPAFNEAHHIERNLHVIRDSVSRLTSDYEIILVDDGSHDGTWSCAAASRSADERIRVLRYDRNRGKGYALACGTKAATGDYIVFIDADLELPPHQLAEFFERLQRENADAAIGSKWHPASVVTYPWWRRLLSRSYFLLVRLLFNLPLRDTQTGLKVFRAGPIKAVINRLLTKRFAFDVELLSVMHRYGARIVEAPVVVEFGRRQPRIHWGIAWLTFVDTLAIFYRLRLRRYYDQPEDAPREITADVMANPRRV